jgi:hypothetical protein
VISVACDKHNNQLDMDMANVKSNKIVKLFNTIAYASAACYATDAIYIYPVPYFDYLHFIL